MDKQQKSVTLSENERSALQAICRRRKVNALVWKCVRASLLLDAGYNSKTICEILDIGSTVLTEWCFAFAGMSVSFFGLKEYNHREGYLSLGQERATQRISRSIPLETPMRFALIFSLSMATAAALLEPPS